MSTRDRAKQTASATGQFAFNLDGGAAESGYLTFLQAFQVPSAAAHSADANWDNVPVLVNVTSGAAAGGWALMHGTLTRNSTDVLTFTSSANACVQTSIFDTATRTFTALAIASGDAVVLSVVPMGHSLIDVRRRGRIANAALSPGYPGGALGDTLAAEQVHRAYGALMAAGAGAVSSGTGSVAIGDYAVARFGQGYSLGYGARSMQYAGVLAGHRVSLQPYETGSGMCEIKVLQGTATPFTTGIVPAVGVLQATTTNATATNMRRFNPVGAAAGDTPAASFSDYVEYGEGLAVFDLDIAAFDATNDVMRLWRARWHVRNSVHNANESVGGLTKESVITEVGSEAWDFAVSLDTVTKRMYVKATGDAAKSIIWLATYRVSRFYAVK